MTTAICKMYCCICSSETQIDEKDCEELKFMLFICARCQDGVKLARDVKNAGPPVLRR